MKFIRIALIISCVLSAILSRRSHSRRSNPANFESRIPCTQATDCKMVCLNFRVVEKNVNCHESQCLNQKCVCGPASADASKVAANDKCQYAEAPSTPVNSVSPQGVKNRRRRRY